MTKATGTISNISNKTVNTKFGPKPTYSIQVDGEWYKCGFKKPKASTGDVVTFTYTEGTYGKDINMDDFSLAKGELVEASAPPAPPPIKSAPAYSKGVFPIPPLDGQRAIVRQNSVTNAVALLKDVLGADKKMSNADKANEIIAVARMFEAYSCGELDMIKAKEMIEKAKKKAPSVEEVVGE